MSYEDDRIRSKNKSYDDAQKLFDDLTMFGYDSTYITRYAEQARSLTNNSRRYEILSRLISISKSLTIKL